MGWPVPVLLWERFITIIITLVIITIITIIITIIIITMAANLFDMR